MPVPVPGPGPGPGQLTVAVAQPACAGLDVAANSAVHAEVVRAAGARLVVFPELSLTGYDLTAPAIAPDDARLAPITAACRETGSTALICAAVTEPGGSEPGGTESIALLALTGEGTTVVHRKMYLHGQEIERFTPGAEHSVLELDGVRIGLAICADVSVPQHAADTAALGIDAYLGSTLYGDSPTALARRDSHLRDAAATHGVWAVLATSAGPSGDYPATSGGSGFWAPGGALFTQAGPETGAVISATI
ncbi:carbon-nitrogen hydrolase family protein [Kitasatospora sp. MAP5-34]|uniref:carbon-nitrogen hydrolase family protein n=1 Tax=Kitasatospora sp. MAP5-34 TaxID=3035102 RepID=UPI0024737745|nr:carbon-nitrogen hydrolase family protein [Kitasatospora sp. MAP5-34]MDH6575345.1 putative amidohydrolase [Kitasatospora sp. MAP5-34]